MKTIFLLLCIPFLVQAMSSEMSIPRPIRSAFRQDEKKLCFKVPQAEYTAACKLVALLQEVHGANFFDREMGETTAYLTRFHQWALHEQIVALDLSHPDRWHIPSIQAPLLCNLFEELHTAQRLKAWWSKIPERLLPWVRQRHPLIKMAALRTISSPQVTALHYPCTPPIAMAFDRDDELAAVATKRQIHLIQKGEKIHVVDSTEDVTAVAFSSPLENSIACAFGTRLSIYHLDNPRIKQQPFIPSDEIILPEPITALAYHPINRSIAIACGKHVYLYNTDTKSPEYRFPTSASELATPLEIDLSSRIGDFTIHQMEYLGNYLIITAYNHHPFEGGAQLQAQTHRWDISKNKLFISEHLHDPLSIFHPQSWAELFYTPDHPHQVTYVKHAGAEAITAATLNVSIDDL